jgi:Dihydrofolate reductase
MYPYGETPVFVPSGGAVAIPAHLEKKVSPITGTPQEILTRLRERGLKDAYIDGGFTIQSFLDVGLVNSAIITEVLVNLGAGIPLCKSGTQKARLELQRTQVFEFDAAFVQKTYAVV